MAVLEDIKYSVYIIDDHPIVIDGLTLGLNRIPQIKVAGFCHNGLEALTRIEELLPQIVLVDLNLPDISGIDLIERIRAIKSDIKVLILSASDEMVNIKRAFDMGADGYLIKFSTYLEIGEQIFKALKGEKVISAQIKESYQNYLSNLANSAAEPLTAREEEILLLLVQSLRNKDIAEKLNLSIRTVESHREHIMKKLGIKDIAGLTRYAIANKLIKL